MTAKKSTKKAVVKTTNAKPAKKPKSTKKPKSAKKSKKKNDSFEDSGLVIVEDDLEIDKEKVNEERKAYLEEARSQEASD